MKQQFNFQGGGQHHKLVTKCRKKSTSLKSKFSIFQLHLFYLLVTWVTLRRLVICEIKSLERVKNKIQNELKLAALNLQALENKRI